MSGGTVRFLGLFVFGVLLAACQSTAGVTPQPEASIAPTFEALSTQVFSNCTTRSCHGAEGGKGDLVLTPALAYENLVGVSASNAAAKAKGKLRVVPGDPDASFLVQKLVSPAPDEGALMPQRGAHLPPAQLEAVKAWIKLGAPRTASTSPAP